MTAELTVPERRPLHALLSPQAHGALQAHAERAGLSITGLIEAIALGLIEGDLEDHTIARARRIDADRRSRQGGYR